MSGKEKPYGVLYIKNGEGLGTAILNFWDINPKPKGLEIYNDDTAKSMYYQTELMSDPVPVFPKRKSSVIFDYPFKMLIITNTDEDVKYFWAIYE